MNSPRINLNTVLLGAILTVGGWVGVALFTEVKETHDTVLVLKMQMIPRSEYDVQMSEIRARLTGVETHQTGVEAELQKLKEHRP